MTVIKREEVAQYIGHEAEPTDWLEVTQDQVNAFADCTLDHQFIHVDPVKAAATPFGGTIAHGFLSLSMLSHFRESFTIDIEGTAMVVNYGFDKVRFLAPVKVGKRIRAHAKITGWEEKKPGQFLQTTAVSIEIEGEDKPALNVEWLAMQFVK